LVYQIDLAVETELVYQIELVIFYYNLA